MLTFAFLVFAFFPIVRASILPWPHIHEHQLNVQSRSRRHEYMRRQRSDVNSTSPAMTTDTQKYVVAHHMVGNTYPYTISDWADDIAQAHAAGIDGFALNTGRDDWQPARVADAYKAAHQSNLGFKLFLSLDMTSLSGSSLEDAQRLRDFVRIYLTHPNQLQYRSRAVVSTFSGESCTFGQGSAAHGWNTQFVHHPDLDGQIFFIPSLFIDPMAFGDYSDTMDGDFNWNAGWPVQLTSSFVDSLTQDSVSSALHSIGLDQKLPSFLATAALAQNELQTLLDDYVGSMAADKSHLDALAALGPGVTSAKKRRGESESRAYMAPVSPWFFTHYGPDSYNKNFIYLSDYWVYMKRWESLVNARDQINFVEILTWNDYGESHYIGPVKGAQPNSQAWVDGFDHTGWLHMTKYYSTAFKTGSFPPIETDQLFIWARTHPANAQASNDPVGPPSNGHLSRDAVWAGVMATQPATVVLSTDPNLAPDQQKRFDVPAGVSQLSIPIFPGGRIYGAILRGNQTVLEVRPQEFVFNGNPLRYNFNAFVAWAQASS